MQTVASFSPVSGERYAEPIDFVCPKNFVTGVIKLLLLCFPLISNNIQAAALPAPP